MDFWKPKKNVKKKKSDECDRLHAELECRHQEFDELNEKIKKIQSARNGRKYTNPPRQEDPDSKDSE